MTCSQPQAHPDRCGCEQDKPKPIGYVYNVDGTLEFNTYCLRHYYRSKYAEHEHEYIQPQAVYLEPPEPDISELEKKDIEIAVLTAELERYKAERTRVIDTAHQQVSDVVNRSRTALDYMKNNVWYWQGDGSDRPETLGCPIIIQPGDMVRIVEDQEGFARFVIEHGGLLEEWAREWKPGSHPPLCDWLEERMRVFYRRSK